MHMQKADPDFFSLLVSSYRRMAGQEPDFLRGGEATADWLYAHSPYAVLAHDTAQVPRFIYANRAAQACFEYSWDEIVGLPSHLSAEPQDRAERQRLLDQVQAHGHAAGYSGVRIAKSGRRFRIEDGVVWQLIDADGVLRGQAASFGRWHDLPGA
jgi:PAS domain-containing protein